MKHNLREISYKNNTSIEKKRRIISMTERAESASCFTHTRKTLIYKVHQIAQYSKVLSEPIITINKVYDTKTKREKFSFRIKGVFYVIGGRCPFKVNFCHSLFIEVIPKLETSYPHDG